MDETTDMERRFDAAIRTTYDEAARLGYRPMRFVDVISEHGGVGTAHCLLATDRIQDGWPSCSA